MTLRLQNPLRIIPTRYITFTSVTKSSEMLFPEHLTHKEGTEATDIVKTYKNAILRDSTNKTTTPPDADS